MSRSITAVKALAAALIFAGGVSAAAAQSIQARCLAHCWKQYGFSSEKYQKCKCEECLVCGRRRHGSTETDGKPGVRPITWCWDHDCSELK